MDSNDSQPADFRFPRRMESRETQSPVALQTERANAGGSSPLGENGDGARFEFGCEKFRNDFINGGFITDGKYEGCLAVEIYTECGEWDGLNVILSRANALALAAWIETAYGGKP